VKRYGSGAGRTIFSGHKASAEPIIYRSSLGNHGSTWKWRKRRKQVMVRDNWTCQYCGAPADSVDHRMPRMLGGGDEMSNLVACCRRCQYPDLRPGGAAGQRQGDGGALVHRNRRDYLPEPRPVFKGGTPPQHYVSAIPPQMTLSGDYSRRRE
jgi:hypothetical protein